MGKEESKSKRVGLGAASPLLHSAHSAPVEEEEEEEEGRIFRGWISSTSTRNREMLITSTHGCCRLRTSTSSCQVREDYVLERSMCSRKCSSDEDCRNGGQDRER